MKTVLVLIGLFLLAGFIFIQIEMYNDRQREKRVKKFMNLIYRVKAKNKE